MTYEVRTIQPFSIAQALCYALRLWFARVARAAFAHNKEYVINSHNSLKPKT